MTIAYRAHHETSLREQSLFRIVLNAMARPGTIFEVVNVEMDGPASLSAASAAVALVLLDSDVTYSCNQIGEDAAFFIATQTLARSTSTAEADFVFVNGGLSAVRHIESAKAGTLLDPESSAMLIASVGSLSPAAHEGGRPIRLTGPGIESEAVFYANGLHDGFVSAVASKNAVFPLGIDVLLTCSVSSQATRVVAIPRTARFV